MERKSILRNNKGGGLILVIGCVALLSLVGAMLLVITNDNRQMKELERKSQQSFYGAESGSDEMVSQLQVEAEAALQKAFADMMVQYSNSGTKEERHERFAEFFGTVLQSEVTAGAATSLMCEALGVPEGELDVDVSFGGVVPGATENEMLITGAEFVYSSSDGVEAKITTDIRINAALPDVEASMADAVLCDFSDFALITGADVNSGLSTSQIVTFDGNVYTKGSINNNSNLFTMNIDNAEKLLVGKELLVANGATINITEGTKSSGAGVWASGVTVKDGGKLTADSNFYVSDDLTISGTGSKVDIDGKEYIGFSGENSAADASGANSAITINTAKDITLDLSGTENLVLTGSSYIHDTLWSSSVSDPEVDTDVNKLGILQGESVAYKDMQNMYLVPGECLTTGHNPMTKSEYANATSLGAEIMTGTQFHYKNSSGVELMFDLAEYLNPSQKYVVRHVILDGGTTQFVYLYLNFASEAMARKYFTDYMSTDMGLTLRKQLLNMGNSKITLAQNNYTLANAFSYNSAEGTYGVVGATNDYVYLGSSSLLAERRRGGLFTTFRLNATSTSGAEYDVIGKKILKMARFADADVIDNTWVVQNDNIDGANHCFWVHDGDVTITGTAPTNSGIILVNGKLTFNSTNFDFNGLVIATGGVEFNSGTTITADPDAVSALMDNPEVQKYFRVAGTTSSAAPWLSTDAVSISFENWQKN